MKTRVMTAAAEKAVDPKKILIDLVQNEGIGRPIPSPRPLHQFPVSHLVLPSADCLLLWHPG